MPSSPRQLCLVLLYLILIYPWFGNNNTPPQPPTPAAISDNNISFYLYVPRYIILSIPYVDLESFIGVGQHILNMCISFGGPPGGWDRDGVVWIIVMPKLYTIEKFYRHMLWVEVICRGVGVEHLRSRYMIKRITSMHNFFFAINNKYHIDQHPSQKKKQPALQCDKNEY